MTPVFHALVPSPLGDILLRADEGHLLGLYFVDQRDCPAVPGLSPTHPVHFHPSAGTTQGRPTRLLKAVPASVARASSGDLFDPGAFAGNEAGGRQDAASEKEPPATLHLQQAATPRTALAVLDQTRRELSEYFAGRRKVFGMALAPEGTTFQRKVWDALLTIPCGETVSYGEVARRAGLEPRHSRAVGTAVGANPISIIIPCHRVLAGNGTLNGYGGGLDRKARLLGLEGFVVG